jgi:hypothetical protein
LPLTTYIVTIFTTTTEFSLAIAAYLNPTDAIIYNYLQDKQRKVLTDKWMEEEHNFREGKWWIRQLGAGVIHEALPCFKSKQTIHDAIDRLETEGLIFTEKTGKFLFPHQRTGRESTDSTAWYYVPSIGKPDDMLRFDMDEAVELDYEIMQAVILQYTREQTKTKADYHKLKLVDMRLALPLTEKSIREHIKELMAKGRLQQLELHPKYYRVLSSEEAAATQSRQRIAAFMAKNKPTNILPIGRALKSAA